MNQHFFRTAIVLASVTILSFTLVACGGKETVASRSAEALRQAQEKGTPIGSGHGGHDAAGTGDHHGEAETTGHHAAVAGMDHSTMAGMDHSKMQHGQQPMAGMDHSAMQHGQQSMAGMDHSQMQHGQQPAAGMDHAAMGHGQQPAAGMDHSQMQHGQQPAAAGMDHSQMPGMQHVPAAVAPVTPPTSNAEMQRLRPAATLKSDPFDAPAPLAVAETNKARQGGGHEGHQMRGITPGQDRENPPTPAPAFRDGAQSGPTGTEHKHQDHNQP
jgi:hypothetical protein